MPMARRIMQSSGKIVVPVITAPANQEIVTVSVAYTVRVTARSDSSVSLYDGATLIGAMTAAGSGLWTYAWTPGSVDYGIDLKAVGNVSGTSPTLTIVVAEANAIDQNISTWSKSNASITYTSGRADPDGGTSAYLVTGYAATNTQMRISKTATVTPTEFNSGFEIWAKPNGFDILMIYPTDGGTHYGYVNVVTGETYALRAYIKIVERRGDWVRIWYQHALASAGPKAYFLYLCHAMEDNTPNTLAGEGMYFFQPRTASSANLPLSVYQKLSVYYIGTTAGVEQWSYRHPYINSEADLAAVPKLIEVILPTGWSATSQYPVLYALPALPKATEDAALDFVSGDYADTYGCVIVMPRIGVGVEWWGEKNDGTINQHGLVAEVMPAFAQEFLAGATGRENQLLIGYSKAANGVYSLILRNPTVFGYACGWDGTWVIDWATEAVSYALDTMFGTEAQWESYDPYHILAANLAAVDDKTRLCLLGYEVFQADQTDMKALLDANSITYSYNAVDTNDHSYGGGWLTDGMARLMSIAGIT